MYKRVLESRIRMHGLKELAEAFWPFCKNLRVISVQMRPRLLQNGLFIFVIEMHK